jgi:hypothetical protein
MHERWIWQAAGTNPFIPLNNMFSFLNTLEILPIEQVAFIAKVLRDSGLDAAVMLKAKAGMPGFISVNAWKANADPLCRTLATELVCCAERRPELQRLLEELCKDVQAGSKRAIEMPEDESVATSVLDGVASGNWGLRGLTCDGIL